MMILEFNEPHCTGGNCRVTLTRQQAIDWAQEVHSELTDEEALEDFITINWAYWVEEEK